MTTIKKTVTDFGTYVTGLMQSTGRVFYGFIPRKKEVMELITKERYLIGVSETQPPEIPLPPF